MSWDDLDIEPEGSESFGGEDGLPAPSAATLREELRQIETGKTVVLAPYLPTNFPLQTLLTFLPDVKLKERVVERANALLAIDLSSETGLVDADVAADALRAALTDAETPFDRPTDLANQLHKRLTGLRADFTKFGKQTLTDVGKAMYAEKKRRDAIAEEARRAAQLKADEEARKTAAALAKDAAKKNAPPDVVDALKQAAKTATAPPVSSPLSGGTLSRSSAVEKWKARLRGTLDGDEPNPKTEQLTAEQQESAKRFFGAISRGEISLAYASINWSKLNDKANAERTTFDVPGFEAFDDGGVRGKGRR